MTSPLVGSVVQIAIRAIVSGREEEWADLYSLNHTPKRQFCSLRRTAPHLRSVIC
jgi:hypothetical protein